MKTAKQTVSVFLAIAFLCIMMLERMRQKPKQLLRNFIDYNYLADLTNEAYAG